MTKVYLLKNAEGNVVSTFERAKLGEAPARPAVSTGYKVEEVDAPEDYTKDLQAFCKKHSRK